MKLPGWVVDNKTSVRREVAPFLHLEPAESWGLVALAGATGSAQLRWSPDPEQVLAWRDPLPRSSIETLARLRAGYRGRR